MNACREKLTGRSVPAIYGRANTLGVTSAKMKGGPRRRHPCSAELDAKIREAWPTLADKGATQRFADAIGVERWIVSRRAAAMGLTKAHRRKEPNWSAAENALMARVPLYDPAKASEIFNEHGFRRSATAIAVHAKRIGLSRRRSDVLSATSAATILGVDIKWITARCINGSLAGAKRGTQRLVQQGGDTWSIAPDALRRFVIDRLEEVDIRKVDKFAFVDLLTRPAPAGHLAAVE